MRTGYAVLITLLAAFSAGIYFEREIGIDVFFSPGGPDATRSDRRPAAPSVLDPRIGPLVALPVPDGSIVFLGDSIIELEEWHELFPGSRVINRGVAGARVSDLTGLFDLRNARAVFCLVGINDIGNGTSVEQFRNDYARLLGSLPPGVPFYALSIPPSFRYGSRAIGTDLIRKCNAVIRHAMHRRVRGTYVDIFRALLRDRAGLGRDAYFASDGLHFSAEGYHVVADAVRPYLEAETGMRNRP